MSGFILQIKRGPEANRTSWTPEPGELLVTTDENKLYVGDGITPGGKPIVGLSPTFNLVSLEWNLTTESGVDTYSPLITDPEFHNPEKGVYIVFYGASKLVSSDYFIDDEQNTITLASIPEEDGENLSIYYIGE